MGAPRRLTLRRAWAPVVVLLVALAGTGAVTAFVSKTVQDRNRMRFDDAVTSTLRDIEDRTSAFVDALHAASALYAARHRVDADEFRHFVDALELHRRHPGVQGIGWAERVEAQRRDEFKQRLAAAGRQQFTVWPATEQAEAYPIIHLAPLDRRNRVALGYDMFSEPARRKAMEGARDTGKPAATSKVRLVQEIDTDIQRGFLIYVPVYEAARTPATVSERRKAIRGFVYSPFRARDLFKRVFQTENREKVSFDIYDGPLATPERLLFSSPRPVSAMAREAALSAERQVVLAERIWTVRLFTTPRFEESSQQHLAPLVLLSGLVLSLLLSAVTWLETRARALSERASTELRRSEQALARSNRVKDEFLAMLGHELRNPLGAIANAVRVLRLRASDDPLMLRAISTAERQIKVQTRLVDDLLDVSRLTSGKIRLMRHNVDLCDIARRAIADALPSAYERKQRLMLTAPEHPLVVEGDPVRLSQVLTNLLSNAVKYTPPEGEIRMELREEAGEVIATVRDSGIGIAPEALGTIFNLFTQTETAKRRMQGGLGIGLTLVRRLVQLHGGRVEAHSLGVDRGSEFVVRLPSTSGPPDALEPSSGPLETVPPPPTSAERVLVIEDNADARQMLADLLGLLGREVEVAEDGEQGVKKALESRPALAFVDVGLPVLNGYEVARRIRAAQNGATPYLVALTGYGQPEDRQRALEAGFDEHLVKPLDIECLKNALEHARARRSATRGLEDVPPSH